MTDEILKIMIKFEETRKTKGLHNEQSNSTTTVFDIYEILIEM